MYRALDADKIIATIDLLQRRIDERFPGAGLARVAADLSAAGSPPALAVLRALSPQRLANALRHWLKRDHGAVPSEAQLQELLSQIAACDTRGHHIRLKIAAGRVEREGPVLRWYNASPLS